jgi:aminopeptidase-like protein
MEHSQRNLLKAGTYHVYIDSTLKKGSLTYGELIIPGATKKEIFISTYICHPSMANNEISGPCVTTYIAKWLSDNTYKKHTIRVVFIPETIGAIAYLSKNIERLKRDVVAGFNVTCVGDDRDYSYLPSRDGNTISDKAAIRV